MPASSIYYKNGDREYAEAFHGSLSEVSSPTSTIAEDPTITILKEMKEEVSGLSTKFDAVINTTTPPPQPLSTTSNNNNVPATPNYYHGIHIPLTKPNKTQAEAVGHIASFAKEIAEITHSNVDDIVIQHPSNIDSEIIRRDTIKILKASIVCR